MPLRPARVLLALAALSVAFECPAGTGSGTFRVNITLNTAGNVQASGICTSQTLSDRTGALVKVVCSTGQFVSISPRPGAPFVGTHGGAFTYYFSSATGARLDDSGAWHPGTGTITQYRVHSLDQHDGIVDMLVNF